MHTPPHEIYIGDNLEVMKSDLFAKYHDSIGLIYIDPPYNTLTRKTYHDKHSSWATFMTKRLEQAKILMRDDATILISIDDNEYANLKLCCDNVFGANNFIGTLITKQAQRSNAKLINIVHEYVLCYAKNKKHLKGFTIKRTDIPEQKAMIASLQSKIYEIFKSQGKPAATKALLREIKTICDQQKITWLRNYCNLDDQGRIYFSVDLSIPGEPRTVDIPEINLHLAPLPTRG